MFTHGISTMNSSEDVSTWSGTPDMYEVVISESNRLSDGNDTTNNGTLSFQGKSGSSYSTSVERVFETFLPSVSWKNSWKAGNKIVVRPEEALIVITVLLLWIGAILLFVRRWGKIRNCEPYAPKFEAENHRGSCHDQANLINKRMSMSSKLTAPTTSQQMTKNPHSFTKGFVSLAIDSR